MKRCCITCSRAAKTLSLAHADYLELVDFLTVDDPGASLALRIDEQWIPGCHGDDDAVLNGELVVREALQVPLADGGVVDERRDQRQVDRVRYAARLQLTLPRVQQLSAEFLVERTSIGQEASKKQNVADQPVSPSADYNAICYDVIW